MAKLWERNTGKIIKEKGLIHIGGRRLELLSSTLTVFVEGKWKILRQSQEANSKMLSMFLAISCELYGFSPLMEN